MPEGPGKYDHLCAEVRGKAKAAGVILIVIEGEHGNGFSAQLPEDLMFATPQALRQVADEMEKDLRLKQQRILGLLVDGHVLLEIFVEAKERFPPFAGLEWGYNEPDKVRDDILVALADQIREGGFFSVKDTIRLLQERHTTKAAGPANRALLWIEGQVKVRSKEA